MITILWEALFSFCLIWVLWVFYLAVMCLKGANDKQALSGFARAAGYSVEYPGLVLDFLVNVIFMTILFVELPHEWLVTARLSRHIKAPSGWRKAIAAWFCSTLLDKFDPSGCHCK